MKYLSKAPIFCTPPNEKYENSWERVFGKNRNMKYVPLTQKLFSNAEDSECTCSTVKPVEERSA